MVGIAAVYVDRVPESGRLDLLTLVAGACNKEDCSPLACATDNEYQAKSQGSGIKDYGKRVPASWAHVVV